MRISGRHRQPSGRWRAPVCVAVGFLAGSVPVSNIAARLLAGTDLRGIGTGTVSGTAFARVAGAKPLMLVGLVELAKGAAGPWLAGPGRPVARAAAGAAAVAGHNWSPWLKGAGGRGISPAMGALCVAAPAGALVLAAGLVAGRLAGETAVGCLAADAVLVPVCRRAHGSAGSMAAAAVLVPMIAKRLAGNRRPKVPGFGPYLWRLLLDRDGPAREESWPLKVPSSSHRRGGPEEGAGV